MTRILHMLDQLRQTPNTPALRLSVDRASHDSADDEQHAWLLIGGEAMRDAAAAVGIDPNRTRLMPRPTGLRRVIPPANRALRDVLQQADRVECWSPSAAALAGQLGCQHFVPRFGQATLCGYAQELIAQSDHANPETAASHAAEDRATLRERWGVEDDTIVVALLADLPDRVDARKALLATAFTFETLAAAKATRRDIRLLCHPASYQRIDAHTLAELLLQPQLVIQDSALATPWSLLRACEIALAPDPTHAGLSILWAQATGLPLIAPPEPRLPGLESIPGLHPANSTATKHLAHPFTEWAFAHQPTPASAH